MISDCLQIILAYEDFSQLPGDARIRNHLGGVGMAKIKSLGGVGMAKIKSLGGVENQNVLNFRGKKLNRLGGV